MIKPKATEWEQMSINILKVLQEQYNKNKKSLWPPFALPTNVQVWLDFHYTTNECTNIFNRMLLHHYLATHTEKV